MKHLGLNSHLGTSGRSLFFSVLIFLPVPLPLPFPDTCRCRRRRRRRACTSREPTSEKCNLSISSATKKRQTMLERRGDKHDAGQTRRVRLQFSQMATFGAHRCGKFKDELDGATTTVVAPGFVCLSRSSLCYCSTDSLLEECGPFKTDRRRGDGCSYENNRVTRKASGGCTGRVSWGNERIIKT